MACSSSIIGVSSICQTNSSRKPTSNLSLSLHFSNHLLAFSSAGRFKSNSIVASAVVTPNSSVLSEEAFKGLGRFGKGAAIDDSESEYDEQVSEGEEEFEDIEAVSDDELFVSKLGLPQRLVETLEKREITHLFPIQRAVLVPALEGRDIIGLAKTGTGKTLAFGIPILKGLDDAEHEKGSMRRGRLPKMLALAPTRELAKQVEKEFSESAPYLSTVCIYGGVSLFHMSPSRMHFPVEWMLLSEPLVESSISFKITA